MKLRILFMLFVVMNAFAQTGVVKGRVIDKKFSVPITGTVLTTLQAHRSVVLSDGEGNYMLCDLPVGLDTLKISAAEYDDSLIPIAVRADTELVPDVIMADTKYRVHALAERGGTYRGVYEAAEPEVGMNAITGRVYDRDTHEPISNALITVEEKRQDRYEKNTLYEACCFTLVTDSAGGFAMHRLMRGRYTMGTETREYEGSGHIVSALMDRNYEVDFLLMRRETAK